MTSNESPHILSAEYIQERLVRLQEEQQGLLQQRQNVLVAIQRLQDNLQQNAAQQNYIAGQIAALSELLSGEGKQVEEAQSRASIG